VSDLISQEELDKLNERFEKVQERDGLPCPDTGMTHCRNCHGAFAQTVEQYDRLSSYEPSCGHWVGCPEC